MTKALIQSSSPCKDYATASSVCFFPLIAHPHTLTCVPTAPPACRALTHTVISTLYYLLDTQASLAKLSYFSLRPRACLSLRLARITLALPLALEQELRYQHSVRARSRARRLREHRERFNVTAAEREDDAERDGDGRDERVFFPRRVMILIEGIVLSLEKMEGMLK